MEMKLKSYVLLSVTILIVLINCSMVAQGAGPIPCWTDKDCPSTSFCRDEKHFFTSARTKSECDPKRGKFYQKYSLFF